MAARKAQRVRSVASVEAVSVEDPTTDRAIGVVRDAVVRMQATRSRVVVDFDLVVGTNKVPHGLGRACAGYSLTATVADATFAHAIDRTNPRPDLEVWITVVGVAQPAATIEVF